jgi:hypothetical protein
VFEFVLRGEREQRPFAVTGAAVVSFDDAQRARTLRLYFDVITLRGQIDPTTLPAGMKVRTATAAVSNGTGVLSSAGTAEEKANLELTNAIWAALDAHDPALVMASSSDDYVYEDFAAPHALNKVETERVVAGFLAAIPDFEIAAKPVQIAAGDEVVTEMIEHGTFRGRAITLHGLDVKRFAGGRVVEEWQYSNYAEVLSELFGK